MMISIKWCEMPIIRRLLCLLFVAAALCAILSSCSEVEDLIDGEELLPDMSTDDFRDENGVIRWPAEILPEGFPVPDYVEVYSVTREHNVVTITVFSEYYFRNINDWKVPHNDLAVAMAPLGYFTYEPIGGNPDYGGYYYNKSDKTRVIIYQADWDKGAFGEHLVPLKEKSPTGFVMQIVVDKTILQPESMLWDYPSADTDLGLEAIKFDEWPSEYLPESIPSPVGQGINVKLKMEQKKNGVFITVSGEVGEAMRFGQLILNGYANTAYHDGKKYNDVYMDKYGNYIFFEELSSVLGSDGTINVVDRYQICKFNEFVNKGDEK